MVAQPYQLGVNNRIIGANIGGGRGKVVGLGLISNTPSDSL